MEQEIRECFSNVKDSTNAALAHYQIWFTIRGEGKGIDEYYEEMNDYRYLEFFRATTIAHYKLMFIELGCIFDTDSRADGIKPLKALMGKNGLGDIAEKFETQLQPYYSLVSNIKTIRSKLIAHKETEVETIDLYRKHGIKPNEIKNLLNTLADLMEELEKRIYDDSSYSSVGITDKWENATFSLLGVLRNGRR